MTDTEVFIGRFKIFLGETPIKLPIFHRLFVFCLVVSISFVFWI